MTIEQLCSFDKELREMERQFGPLRYAWVGDEDFWIEYCDWEGRRIDVSEGATDASGGKIQNGRLSVMTATDMVVQFRYYYPSDTCEMLCATTNFDHALRYLKTRYLRIALPKEETAAESTRRV